MVHVFLPNQNAQYFAAVAGIAEMATKAKHPIKADTLEVFIFNILITELKGWFLWPKGLSAVPKTDAPVSKSVR